MRCASRGDEGYSAGYERTAASAQFCGADDRRRTRPAHRSRCCAAACAAAASARRAFCTGPCASVRRACSARRAACCAENTGYDEISLTSLSTSDHGQLEELLDDMLEWTGKEHVSMSLPSLRIDNFSQSLVEKTSRVRKSGLTFAPEEWHAAPARRYQ